MPTPKSRDRLWQTPRDINHAREILRADLETFTVRDEDRLAHGRAIVRDIHATEEVATIWIGALSEYTKPKTAKQAYLFSFGNARCKYLYRVWPGSAAAPARDYGPTAQGDVYKIYERVRGAGKGLGSALFVIECRKQGDTFQDRKLHRMILQAHKACTEILKYIDSRFENRRSHAQRNGAKE